MRMSNFSVNTNLGAMAALASLRDTANELSMTQNEVSTGKSVSSASDNPAIYAIANTMNANISGLSAVSSSLNFGAQVVNTASTASADVIGVINQLQQTVTQSGQTGIDLTTMQNQVNADLTSINQYARAATFNGVNLLTTTTDSGASFGTLNVVQGVNGSVYSVANQAQAVGGGGVTTLTDALGLTGLSVTGGTTGVSLTFDNNLVTSSFAPMTAASPPGAQTASVLNLTAGSQTYAFEFTDDAVPGTALQTNQGPNTQVIAVHINSATMSTDQMVGALNTALQNNGFGVVQQVNGGLNIVGRGVTAANWGTVSGGTFSAAPGTGVTTGTLTGTQAAITTVQSALTKMNTISANLGAATKQITGLQSFTSSLSDALTAGVGALTDADLAAASAKLTSLQTKQQLAMQSLSIANQQPQSLLHLFQG
jgi:flagellin